MAEGGVDVKILVPGINKLVSSLIKAGVDVQDLKDANRAAGTIVAKAGQTVAPRLTGALASSIRPMSQARKAVVKAGGAGIRYARFQEFGSRKNRATHYLYGSAERTKSEWLAAYERDLERAIAKIKGE